MNCKIEVLLATMHQVDLRIVDRCCVDTDCLVINQCDHEDYIEEIRDYGKIRMISTKERGLSKSRNMALKNSDGDICVVCDDDIIYKDGYEDIIKKAFEEKPDADVIVFNIVSLNPDIRPQEKLFNSLKKISRYKTYSSVHIAFRRKSILSANISFDERFGSGSGLYSMGEDSLFFTQIHKAKLKAYTYPAIIADLSSETSTWFSGYNAKYFYDVGAFLAAAYPFGKNILKYYYPIRFRKICDLSATEMLQYINSGISGYKNNLSFNKCK